MRPSSRVFAIRIAIAAVVGTAFAALFVVPIPERARPAVFRLFDLLGPVWRLMVADFGDVALPVPTSLIFWFGAETAIRSTLVVFGVSYLPRLASKMYRSARAVVMRSGPDRAAIAAWGALGAVAGTVAGIFAWANSYRSNLAFTVATGAISAGLILPVLRCWVATRVDRTSARALR